jgi:integrase
MRLGEARSACIEDLNLTRKTLFLRDTKAEIHAWYRYVVKLWRLFIQTDETRQSGSAVPICDGTKVAEPRRLMKKICEKAGIVPFTIHELRYTAGSAMLAATRDLYAVKRFLGHKCLSTSERYQIISADNSTLILRKQ